MKTDRRALLRIAFGAAEALLILRIVTERVFIPERRRKRLREATHCYFFSRWPSNAQMNLTQHQNCPADFGRLPIGSTIGGVAALPFGSGPGRWNIGLEPAPRVVLS